MAKLKIVLLKGNFLKAFLFFNGYISDSLNLLNYMFLCMYKLCVDALWLLSWSSNKV